MKTKQFSECLFIERIADKKWLTIDLEWTTDPHKAFRFYSMETAIKWVHYFFKGQAVVTEHSFK